MTYVLQTFLVLISVSVIYITMTHMIRRYGEGRCGRTEFIVKLTISLTLNIMAIIKTLCYFAHIIS